MRWCRVLFWLLMAGYVACLGAFVLVDKPDWVTFLTAAGAFIWLAHHLGRVMDRYERQQALREVRPHEAQDPRSN